LPASTEYQRDWRARHPHYGRNWQRRNRDKAPREDAPYKRILGAMVGFQYFRPLRFNSKQEAEYEFIRLLDS
jgi:hypothetical protein